MKKKNIPADTDATASLNPIIAEAQKRFKRCAQYEGVSRQRGIEDIKFAEGDSDNGWQWPNEIRQARTGRPCLTLNITRQHNLQIINEMKRNRLGVVVKPVGGGATKESADTLLGIIRHIEYRSQAQTAYDIGRQFQVKMGIGWWRLLTDYDDANSWDQELFIAQVDDPFSVYMDPDIQQKNGLDAKFAFVFDNVPKAEFSEAYPKFADKVSNQPLQIADDGGQDWLTDDYIRVAEYFRKVQKRDELLSFVDGATGERKTIRASKLSKEMVAELKADSLTRARTVYDDIVEWKLIVGNEVIDETTWPGRYIPLIRVIGEETKIEGTLDRKGHTRAMKDAQRMLNYNASGQVEFVALQGKTPWVAPAKAIEEYEQYWRTANTVNHSVLPYNHMDDDSNPIPPPQRTQPPTAAPAFQVGMETAFNQVMMVSGQWQNQMGMMGNERTGAAISQRQEQGDTATLHFDDHYRDALRTTGIMLIDSIPRVYDTQRIILIQADDGSDTEVEINPAAQQAFQVKRNHDNEVVRRIFNPNLGRYQVQADAGPSFGTRREETVKAMTLLLTQAPALTGIIGDLMLQSMDFKEAQEAAQRLRRMVPPQALGEGPTQNEQMLTQQVNALSGALAKALEAHGKDRIKLVGKAEARDIDAYQAETQRIQAIAKLVSEDPEAAGMLMKQLLGDALGTQLLPLIQANAQALSDQSGQTENTEPGAGNEGNELHPRQTELQFIDPTRVGRVMRVAPLVRERPIR